MLRCDLPLRSDTGALATEGRLSETRMYKTSRPFYYQNHKRSRESETPAPTTDSLDLSNYCPSDLIPQADLSMSGRNSDCSNLHAGEMTQNWALLTPPLSRAAGPWLGQCESVVGQTPHTPRHQNVAARRATARLSKPARAERARSRLPDALLWSLKFAENLSFRSASVATHTHTSSPLANCPTTDSHCDGPARYPRFCR